MVMLLVLLANEDGMHHHEFEVVSYEPRHGHDEPHSALMLAKQSFNVEEILDQVVTALIFKRWRSTRTSRRLWNRMDADGMANAVNRQGRCGLEPQCSGLDPLLRGYGAPWNRHGGLTSSCHELFAIIA